MRKIFVYFLCVSFLLLAIGFHTTVAEAKEISRPMGEMVSRGEVKFESRENVWKNVEPSHFPIFQGVKIKTEKGASMITLENDGQIEVAPNSLLSLDRNDRMRLTQGAIDFRFPSTTELSFKVGNLTVSKAKSLQASQNPSAVSTKSEGTIGSISVHPNGSITVKSIRGALSIVDQEHVVLAALSSKDTVTIPSASAKGSSQGMVAQVIVAQAGDTTTGGGAQTENWEFLGLSTWWWVGIIAGVAAVAAIVAVAAGGGGGGGGGGGVPIPICP